MKKKRKKKKKKKTQITYAWKKFKSDCRASTTNAAYLQNKRRERNHTLNFN